MFDEAKNIKDNSNYKGEISNSEELIKEEEFSKEVKEKNNENKNKRTIYPRLLNKNELYY